MNTPTMMCTFLAHSERVGARMRKKFVLPLRLRKTLTTKLTDLSLCIHTYIHTSSTHIRVSTNKFTTHLVLDQVCLTYYTRGPVVSKLGTNGHLLAKLRLDHQTVQNTQTNSDTGKSLANHWYRDQQSKFLYPRSNHARFIGNLSSCRRLACSTRFSTLPLPFGCSIVSLLGRKPYSPCSS